MTQTNLSPLVSIIIPTHNRADLLPRAIKSVLSQSYTNYEIIVVDDGSVDNTQEVLLKFKSDKLRFLKNETPKGACNARNKGIQAAAGELLAFLDDDDEYLPTYFEENIKIYDPKWAYIFSRCYYIYKEAGKVKKLVRKKNEYVDAEQMLYEMSAGNYFVANKKKILKVGGFDENLEKAQDYDVLLRLNLKFGTAYCLQRPLYIMHAEHEKPRITYSPKSLHALWIIYKKYRHLYNRKQRKYRLYKIMQCKNKPITLEKLFWLVPRKYFLVNLKLTLGKKFPSIKEFYHRYNYFYKKKTCL